MYPQGKIIVVDDSPFDYEFISLALRETRFGGELIWLKTGVEFLSYLETHPWQEIVFVLMDLKMPCLSGVETLQKLPPAYLGKFPILMMSSSNQDKDVQNCWDLGACAFIAKPIGFEEFCQTFQQIWTFWGELNEISQLRLASVPFSLQSE
ncbi:MAG: response regulator [Bacteroidota bacterium]